MTVYKLDTNNMLFIILILVVMGLFGIAFFFYPSIFASAYIRSSGLIKLAGIFLTIISVVLLLGYGSLIFSNYGFKITEEGIVNNTNLTNVGVIYWNDIARIKIKTLKKNVLILVFVKNDNKYYERVKNPLKKINILTYKKLYGASFVIETKNLLCSVEELESVLQKKMLMYKK